MEFKLPEVVPSVDWLERLEDEAFWVTSPFVLPLLPYRFQVIVCGVVAPFERVNVIVGFVPDSNAPLESNVRVPLPEAVPVAESILAVQVQVFEADLVKAIVTGTSFPSES